MMRAVIAKAAFAIAIILASVIGLPAGSSFGGPVRGTAAPLTISPTSGSVGSVVHIHYVAGANCGLVVFVARGGRFGTSWLGGQFGRLPEAFHGNSLDMQVVIPQFLGGDFANPVVPGHYEFAYSCGGSVQPSVYSRTKMVPFTVTAPNPERFVGMASAPDGRGYWLVQAGGGVFSYGDAKFEGSLPEIRVTPASPIVAMASTPDGGGYWLLGADGGVFAFGDAPFVGSIPQSGLVLAGSIIGMVPTADGRGYWLMGADGGGDFRTAAEFAFGDAPFCDPGPLHGPGTTVLPPGTISGSSPNVAASGNPTSVGSTGFSETDAAGDGLAVPGDRSCSTPLATGSTAPFTPIDFPSSQISGMATSGSAMWLVGIDGGVFTPVFVIAFTRDVLNPPSYPPPQAPLYGSLPGLGITPRAPIVGIAAAPSGQGYWLVGADGGVFAFGHASFLGSATR